MKLKACILTLLIIGATAFSAHSATSLSMIARWPYTPVASFLHPSPNAVTSGIHKNFTDPNESLIIWAVGDTVSILKSSDMSLVTVFRVETSTIIHDMHYRSNDGPETLYLAAGKSGLLIYDLSGLCETPPSIDPVLKSTLSQAPDNPGSRPASGSETATEEVPQIDARGLGYFNDHIFLADSNFGMRVIKVVDPTDPSEVLLTNQTADRTSGYKQPDIYGSYRTTGGYTNATVCEFGSRVYAFILDYYYGLRVFDVTDPKIIEEPVSKDMRTNLLYGTIALVTGLFAAEAPDGNLYAYVTAMDSYAQYSVVSKLKILSAGSTTLEGATIINTGRCLSPGSATGILTSDVTGFLADGDKGLQVIDFSQAPVEDEVLDYPIKGSHETETRGSYSVHLLDDYIYMGVAENGLQKIDVKTPSAPEHKKTVPSPISGDAVAYLDNHTYLLDGDSGLIIFDSSEPSYLIRTGFFLNNGPAYDIAVLGNHAYIANGASGLTIVDVSDKTKPTELSTTGSSGTAKAVAIYEAAAKTYACIANGDTNPYTLMDVSSPSSPEAPIAAGNNGFTPAAASDVAIFRNFACFADDRGLKIVDISNPAAPLVVAEKTTPTPAAAVAVFEKDSIVYALIADNTQGITIENITDPENIPATVAVIPPPDSGSYKHIDIKGHFAFAAAGQGGLSVFDLADPEEPVKAASSVTKSSAEQVSAFVEAETLYVALAEKYNGVVINKISETEEQEPAPPLETSSSAKSCFINSL